MRKEIQKIGDKVLEGGSVSMKEILPFLEAEGPDILDLAAVANRVRVEIMMEMVRQILRSMIPPAVLGGLSPLQV